MKTHTHTHTHTHFQACNRTHKNIIVGSLEGQFPLSQDQFNEGRPALASS